MPTQAVILAAGNGARLHPLTTDTPKPLVELHGRPIIHHVLDALAEAGVTDATVVLGYRGEQVRAALEVLHPTGMTIRFVENPEYHAGNASSIAAVRGTIDGPFLLAMADHLVAPALTRALTAGADGRCRLAIEPARRDDERAFEATLAMVRDGLVVNLGKGLADWNALDTGTFWCTPRVFDAIDEARPAGEAGAVFATLARAGELDAIDVTGHMWIDIDTEDDLRRAGEMIRSAAHPPDTSNAGPA